jgi:periplasmic divalent cation tolerance protein
MRSVRIVLTTVGSGTQAEELACNLVEQRLAACVNIVGPIRSVYRWKGRVENEQEFLLVIKTSAERSGELAAALTELHPYELPERIELDPGGGSAEYLSWVAGEVAREG